MSLSKKDRTENLKFAIGLFLDQLGDHGVEEMYFSDAEEEYKSIYPTTWADLLRRRWLKDVSVMEETRYRLTEHGWSEGIILIRRYENRDFQDRIGKLSATMKGFVKGRKTDAIVDVEEISEKSGIETGFIQNVIEGHVFEYCFRTQGADWTANGRFQSVLIPLDFGLEQI